MNFEKFFHQSTKQCPYDYQQQLATAPCASRLISIPTGLGKTAAVIQAWLWNRLHHPAATWPRRLIYCLPMRTLVEQTHACAQAWLTELTKTGHEGIDKIGLHMLMGGAETEAWEKYPENPAILIGTQDMLLSRALNRGYGASRFRWPMHYGLLNNDALWVFDEVQLMGAGLPTTAQLEAFRKHFGLAKSCHSWWMSATSDPAWIQTVDFDPTTLSKSIQLETPDLETDRVKLLRNAKKTLSFSSVNSAKSKELGAKILETVANRDGLTLVVMNTVKQARSLHQEICKALKSQPAEALPILLHSQFRPDDRARQLAEITCTEGQKRIVISTQIIEAGIDISAATLFTEMAPWSSLVQRFGRCNRRGTEPDAQIFLITPEKPLPYTDEQLTEAKARVDKILASDDPSAAPARLSQMPIPACDRPPAQHVIRRRDFVDLFDTTPDLAGQDLDIDRWVRDIEDSKVQFIWRVWEGSGVGKSPPKENFSAASRAEHCPAPVADARTFCDKLGAMKLGPRRWDHLSETWLAVTKEGGKYLLVPGQVYLLPAAAGGYDPSVGFDHTITKAVIPVHSQGSSEGTDSDQLSESPWQSIAEHTDDVCTVLEYILTTAQVDCPALPIAARWHDFGKAHDAFQAKIKPADRANTKGLDFSPIAKAPSAAWKSHWAKDASDDLQRRPYFRHELASALAVLQPGMGGIDEDIRNLVAWLVATHHGKIRLSLRALPNELLPSDGQRYARGVWDGDALPSVDLGGGVLAPAVVLSLEPMELGLGQDAPFTDEPSWAERMLTLRDHPEIGLFRLAYWECLLRAADERASAAPSCTSSAPPPLKP